MSLHIMTRLSSLGHELYDRVFHRGVASQTCVPEPMDDMVTARIPRDEHVEVAHDLASIDFDQVYGEDARTRDAQLDDDHDAKDRSVADSRRH